MEAYGQYARFSAIADVLELSALKGRTVRRAHVIDWLRDAAMSISSDLMIPEEELDGRRSDDYELPCTALFDLFAERMGTIGSLYPFSVTTRELSLRRGMHKEGIYTQLLALTVAHAHDVKTRAKPTVVFERLVSEAFRRRGWKSVCVGASRGKLQDSLVTASKQTNLPLRTSGAPHSRRANDDKIDVLAHFSLADSRPGRFTAIGQVTLEKSSGWARKAQEPPVRIWADYMNEPILPYKFLAVPHHVENRYFLRLTRETNAIVLDRLRMALMLRSPHPEMTAIFNAVVKARVEFGED